MKRGCEVPHPYFAELWEGDADWVSLTFAYTTKYKDCLLNSNLRQDHPWMRAFNYACSLPLTWQRWRLHYSIHRTHKRHAANKHRGSMFDRMGVIADRNFTLWEMRIEISDRILWPWPWSDDLHIRTRPVVRYAPHVQIRTSYVKAFGSYRLTYRQTDRTKLFIYHFPLRVVKNAKNDIDI